MADFFAKGNNPIGGYAEPPADTGWLTTSSNYVTYRKIGNVVTVKLTDGYTNSGSTSWVTLATLPEGYRPQARLFHCVFWEATNKYVNIQVNASGGVQVSGYSALGSQISFIAG